MCHVCGNYYHKQTHWREIMAETLEVEVYLSKKHKEVNQWIIAKCPVCGKTHYHGAGSKNDESKLKLRYQGGRSPHCALNNGADIPHFKLIWKGKILPDNWTEKTFNIGCI
jgi:hypothetical protein